MFTPKILTNNPINYLPTLNSKSNTSINNNNSIQLELNQINQLGYNYLKPIGINKTMKDLEIEKNNQFNANNFNNFAISTIENNPFESINHYNNNSEFYENSIIWNDESSLSSIPTASVISFQIESNDINSNNDNYDYLVNFEPEEPTQVLRPINPI
ncbi:hypothetical protein WICMUC_001685 [Wickerhamomyces mucosus]|uniref:Uncharacterized protein n=1 Tax=Wickerhamomyces mucosus TaxID=1378264 RepID=A0A9P8TGL7_9ASCO|nr:hypothetical protein WICMUC_001685 [Wickerhamomyces mucosus]